MEFIAEIIVAIVQFTCEVLLQLLAQGLFDLTWYSSKDKQAPSRSVGHAFQIFCFSVVGGICAGLSLLMLPRHFAATTGIRLLTLLLAPVVCAAASMPLLHLLRRRFYMTDRRWQVGNAYAFALAFALVRFAYAH